MNLKKAFLLIVLTNSIAVEARIYSLIFKVEYKFELSTAYEANGRFEAAYQIDKKINQSYIKCLSQCVSKSNCISAIFTKYNNILSSCSTYSSSPALSVNLILTKNSIISQKIFTKNTGKLSLLINQNKKSLYFNLEPISTQIALAFGGVKRLTLTAHSSKVSSLDLLQNGDLVSGSSDSTINIWEIASGALKKTLKAIPSVVINAVVVLKNGDIAVGGNDQHVSIWDINSQIVKLTMPVNWQTINALVVLQNDFLASGLTDNSIMIFNSNNGSLITTLRGHSQQVTSLVTTTNGDLISGSSDNSIRIWDANNFSLKSTLTGTASILSLAFLQNGYLATGLTDHTIKIWNLNTGLSVNTFTAHNGEVNSMSLLPDGSLATVSSGMELKIWNTTSWATTKTLMFNSPDSPWVLKTLPNGELACGSNKTIPFWLFHLSSPHEIYWSNMI